MVCTKRKHYGYPVIWLRFISRLRHYIMSRTSVSLPVIAAAAAIAGDEVRAALVALATLKVQVGG
jgi:hypothetical protein